MGRARRHGYLGVGVSFFVLAFVGPSFRKPIIIINPIIFIESILPSVIPFINLKGLGAVVSWMPYGKTPDVSLRRSIRHLAVCFQDVLHDTAPRPSEGGTRPILTYDTVLCTLQKAVLPTYSLNLDISTNIFSKT